MVAIIMPERLAARMEALGLSQSAVARAIGVKPPSISRLVKGKHTQTRHIFSLARAVHSTPEYLMGVTDDPEEGEDTNPDLSHGQQEWLELYAGLSRDQRNTVKVLLRDLVRANVKITPPIAEGSAGSHIAGATA